MKYHIRLHMEDDEGGSWDRTEQFETQTPQGAEDAAVEFAINELGPVGDRRQRGELIASEVCVTFIAGGYDRAIYVKGTRDNPDISIY